MGELANALAEVFAALLRAVGFVGRPRRRAAIRDDLAMLRELDDFPSGEFGPGTAPHIWLTTHIYQQVGEFSGLDFRTERRKIPWSAVVVALAFSGGLGWLTYHLISIGDGWWATFPAIPAGVFLVAVMGLLGEKEEIVPGDPSVTTSDEEALRTMSP